MAVIIVLAVMAIAAFLIYGFIGGGMDAQTIQGYASNAGFNGEDLNIAVAIALAESSGNPSAVGDNGDSIGLWQIDTKYHPEYDKVNLTDPQYNANAAFGIYSEAGNTFYDWSTYDSDAKHPNNSGAYRQYLPAGDTAA